MNEPDYTLTITEQNGRFIVCEGGEEISRPFEDRREAEWWLNEHWAHRQRCRKQQADDAA
jgi:hypothetical protein